MKKVDIKQTLKISPEKLKTKQAVRQHRQTSKRSNKRHPQKRGRKPKYLKNQKDVKEKV